MRNFFALAASICATASAVLIHQDDEQDYSGFDKLMQSNGAGFSWEAIDVETEDGYELTLFHITGDENGEPVEDAGSAGPTLLIHGFSGNAMSWLHRQDDQRDATPVQLYREGHDVYIASTRGSTFSQGHTDFDFDSEEYWDFAREEIALNDLPALIQAAQLHSKHFYETCGCKKVKLLASSAGSEQVYHLLSKADGMESQVQSIFTIAPAFSASPVLLYLLSDVATPENLGKFANQMRGMGIFSLFGADWDKQTASMCEVEYGEDELNLCDFSAKLAKVRFGTSPISLKLFEAFSQSAMVLRYQDYVDTDTFAMGGESMLTDLIDVTQISEDIPVTAFVGTQDVVISNDVINVVLQPLIERGQAEIVSDTRGHMMIDDNDEAFVQNIIDGLGDSESGDCHLPHPHHWH